MKTPIILALAGAGASALGAVLVINANSKPRSAATRVGDVAGAALLISGIGLALDAGIEALHQRK